MRPLLTVLAALALVACSDRGEEGPAFRAETAVPKAGERQEIAADIRELAKGKDPDDVKASAAYDQARLRLERRGAAAETALIDALRTSEDWGIRLGCIEVLQSVGTRRCVEHLIAALQDDHPLVSFQAEIALRAITDHREIPPAGAAPGPNGLPPLPVRDPDDLALDAEQRLWARWHAQHRHQLFKAWDAWWKANARTAVIR